MEKINSQTAKEGMLLAETIYNNDGELLFEKGTILDSSSINRLAKFEIDYIAIYTTDDNKEVNKMHLLEKFNLNNINKIKIKIYEEIKSKFSNVSDSALMSEILEKTVEYEYKTLGINNL